MYNFLNGNIKNTKYKATFEISLCRKNFWAIKLVDKCYWLRYTYRDRRVERHSDIYKPLGISDAYYCLVI